MPGNLRRPRDMVWLHQISCLSVSGFGVGSVARDSNKSSAFTEGWFPRHGRDDESGKARECFEKQDHTTGDTLSNYRP